MKKLRVFITLILPFLVTLTLAQGLYVKAGGGYAMPIASQNIASDIFAVYDQNGGLTSQKQDAVNGSYGAGINVGASVGYKLSPFIGIDLNINYLMGKEYNGTTEIVANISGTLSSKIKSSGIFISPAVMFMAGTGKVRPYSLIGPSFGSVTIKTDSTVVIFYGDNSEARADVKTETKGKLAIGFRGGLGVDFQISELITLYAEGIFTAMNFKPTEKEITEAIITDEEGDVDDVLADMDEYDRKVVYKSSLSVTSSQTSPDDPRERLQRPQPLSNLAFNVGIKLKFGSD